MSTSIIGVLGGLAYYTFFIVLAVKGKMKISSFSLLLLTSIFPIVLGLILIYALPIDAGTVVEGPVLPVLPIIVGFVLFAFALLVLKHSTADVRKHNSQSSSTIGWSLIILGVIVNTIGLIVILMSIYAPSTFGYSASVPQIGVPSFITLNCFSAILIYLGSRRNPEKKPNLLRWVSFFVILISINYPFIISCILIYAYPDSSQVHNIAPFWAGMNTIGFLPYSLLLLFLSREHKTKIREEAIAYKYTADGEVEEIIDDSSDLQKSLKTAISNEDTDALLESIDRGADINKVDQFGYTPLMTVAEAGKTDTARILISKGADVNAEVSLGQNGCVTALMYAASNGHSEIVKLLIDNGADVNVENYNTIGSFAGLTALKYAIHDDHVDVVKILLKNGANVNAKGPTGSTALMIAVDRDNAEIVRMLLENGADVNAETNNGSSVRLIADQNGRTEILKILDKDYAIETPSASLQPNLREDLAVVTTSFPGLDAAQEILTNSTDSDAREDAATALGKTNLQQVVPALSKALLKDQDRYVRSTCAGFLGSIKGVEAEKALLEAVTDSDPYVREKVLQALFRLGTKLAMVAIEAAQNDDSEEVRTQAKWYASKFSEKLKQRLCPFLSETGMCDPPGVCDLHECSWETEGKGKYSDCYVYKMNTHSGGPADFLVNYA